MPNILLARIDNRLIHGQVGVTWTTSLGANLLVVVDDEVAQDTLQQELMTITTNSIGVGVRFFTIAKTIEIIHKASEAQKIFIIAKTPEVIAQLLEGGVPIPKVNVGNMHFAEGKERLSTKVYVDDHDRQQLEKIKSFGVYLFIQDVPGMEIIKL